MLSRSLIAAAGNAGGGGLSYWVDRIQQTVTTTPSCLRATVNPTNENIFVYCENSSGGASQSNFIELDYDGGLITSKYTLVNAQPYHCSVQSLGNLNYMGNLFSSSNVAVYKFADGVPAPSPGYNYLTQNFVGFVPGAYEAPAFNMVAYEYAGNDVFTFVRGGYTSTYWTGFGYVFTPQLHVSSYIAANNTTTGGTSASSLDTVGYGYRDAMIIQSRGGDPDLHVLFCNDPYTSNNVFYTYDRGNTTSPFLNGKTVPYSANFEGKGLFLSPDDKLTAVGAVTTSTTWVFRNLTAGQYWPDRYYSFSHNATMGYLTSSSMDAEGNVYLLYANNYLVKFSSSNTISWAIQITCSVAPAQSTTETLSEVKIQAINDEEFMLLSMGFATEGASVFSFYPMKLPLDLNNYLGTYGVITFSAYSFSPTVTLNTFTPSNRGPGNTNTVNSWNASNLSPGSITTTLTTSSV